MVEPERPIELEPLRRASIVTLTTLRLLAGLLGVAVIGFAGWHAWHTEEERGTAIAWFALGLSFGVPLLMPLLWQRRHLRWLLPVYLLLWLLPIAVDPEPLAFILRMFATSVAITALILWHLLLSLTKQEPEKPPPV
ncbi:MAG: hypothetical protein IPK26_00330 [Planctomycetes bacterium]|nr:hypothetical protein [Planctomycetota bacterium]